MLLLACISSKLEFWVNRQIIKWCEWSPTDAVEDEINGWRETESLGKQEKVVEYTARQQ